MNINNPTFDHHNTNLNKVQQMAVEYTQGPLLILAGAGTGKTHVLTERVRYILNSSLALSNEMLVVTFTNKASLELKERLSEFAIPFLGTFHKIFLNILKAHAQKVDLNPYFSILDTDEQARVMKEVMLGANMDIKRFAPSMVLWKIERLKDKGIGPHDKQDTMESNFSGISFASLYERYQMRLNELNAVDFGDLLYYPYKIFSNYPDVLQHYAQRFKYILVDEYQDTNTIQYQLIKQLASYWFNVCCVGDEDQSIYSWRGADIDNILRFEKDFPNSKIVRLEANYRSTSKILNVAQYMIGNNKLRLGKDLYAATHGEQDREEPVLVYSTWSSKDEADLISELIQSSTERKHTAILVRMTAQTRELEESLLKYNIPYRLVGTIKFYEREEIKDILAYLKYVLTKQDLALLRIINKPSRKIGPSAIDTLRQYAKQQGISISDAINRCIDHPPQEIPTKYHQTFHLFAGLTVQLRHILTSAASLSEGIWALFQATGLHDRYKDTSTKIDNIKEMMKALQEFESYDNFLEHVSLMMDVQDFQSDKQDDVKVMTLHAAKGLEFDSVYLPGWEEGIFPSGRALEDSSKNLEEERRLAYVGITRGKKKVVVLYALNRTMYGRYAPTMPSRFLKELPKEYVKFIDVKPKSSSFYHYQSNNYRSNDHQSTDHRSNNQSSASYTNHHSTRSYGAGTGGTGGTGGIGGIGGIGIVRQHSMQRSSKSLFSVGQDCVHKTFGHGVVVALEGDRVRVYFDNGQERIILEDYLQSA